MSELMKNDQQFQPFTVVHLEGRSNKVADALSHKADLNVIGGRLPADISELDDRTPSSNQPILSRVASREVTTTPASATTDSRTSSSSVAPTRTTTAPSQRERAALQPLAYYLFSDNR